MFNPLAVVATAQTLYGAYQTYQQGKSIYQAAKNYGNQAMSYLGKRKTMTGPQGKRYKTVLGYSRSGGVLSTGGAPAAIRAMGLRRRYRSQIKGAISAFGGQKELKYTDIANTAYAADTTGSVTALNLIAEGDDNTTRDGRRVTIKSVQVRGYLEPVDGGTATSKCRLILVWDNAVNSGAIATVAQILSAASGNSFPLVDNANRFTILVDRTYTLGLFSTTATQAVAQSPTTGDVEIYKKLNCVTQYSGTTAAIGSIQNGGLLMVTIGTSAPANGGQFAVATRVRFTDN